MVVEEKSFSERLSGFDSKNQAAQIRWNVHAKTDSNSIIRLGSWSVGALMLVFVIWGSLFPLSSAVITPGTFVSEGKNKLIQHSSGGRVHKIFVVEGEQLEKGQAILELDQTQVRAELTRLQARHSSLSALRARLDAERSGGLRRMAVPQLNLGGVSLRGNGDSSFVVATAQKASLQNVNLEIVSGFQGGDELYQSQRDAYLSGQKLLSQEIKALEKKAETLQKQRDGLRARENAQQALLVIARREYRRLKPLADAGYVARNRLNERERTMLELQGAATALGLDVLAVGTQISEISVLISKARIASSDVASKQYTKIIGEIAEISDQLKAAEATVKGSVIRAPASGTLLRMVATTVGGVIGAGDKIGEIVPQGTPLVVQARVLPGDIDYVQIGQEAKIAVTAFNRQIDDSLKGRVVYKSADASKDEKSGDPYFTVRLELLGNMGTGRSRFEDIQAGMQSEIYIHTGSRTFMTYMAKPMIDSFRRAFREQ